MADKETPDWAFTPSVEELRDLNALREHWGLSRIDTITRAREWSNACAEIDACAEADPALNAVYIEGMAPCADSLERFRIEVKAQVLRANADTKELEAGT